MKANTMFKNIPSQRVVKEFTRVSSFSTIILLSTSKL